MLTKIQWNNSKKDFTSFVWDVVMDMPSLMLKESIIITDNGNARVEIDEDIHEYFLCVLPPIYGDNGKFLMSEPYAHNNKGQAVYLAFSNKNDKYYYDGQKTREWLTK